MTRLMFSHDSVHLFSAQLGTIDYVQSDKIVVFRTHPSEKSRLVFQLVSVFCVLILTSSGIAQKYSPDVDLKMCKHELMQMR